MTASSSSRPRGSLPHRRMSTERLRGRVAALLVVVMVATTGLVVGYWRMRLSTDHPTDGNLCRSDDDCAAQFVCRPRKLRDGRMGRACRIRGTGREGEPCRSPAMELHESCLAALRCNYGFCGRPCAPDLPEACPSGMRCRDSGEGFSCVPSCNPGACMAPMQCVVVDPDFTVCAIPIGERCDLHPCRPETVCRSQYRQGRTVLVESRCVVPCAAALSDNAARCWPE